MLLILGITTYNRLDYLKQLIDSFIKYTDINNNRWLLIIHNDNLRDATTEYIQKLNIPRVIIFPIFSNRIGVHAGTNEILRLSDKFDFDYAFKADDDIFFTQKNWEIKYINAIKEYKFQHLSYFNENWNKNLIKKCDLGLKYHGSVWRSQGAFWTYTKEIIKTVGYFDVNNMGFRGIGHINYSYRCCKAGFNNENEFYDLTDSNCYIEMHQDYKASLPREEILKHRSEQSNKIKITQNSPIYIPYC